VWASNTRKVWDYRSFLMATVSRSLEDDGDGSSVE
jgi:hypothetical protein